jgi:lipooligosaccharide transport system permease protein
MHGVNLKRALRVWQRHVKVYTKLYLSSLTLNVIEPVLYLTAMGLGLGSYLTEMDGMPYVNFIAPGIIAYSGMFAASGECSYGTFIRMTYQKTFDAILATPVSLEDLVTGEICWGATKSMIYGTIIIGTISVMGLVESPLIIMSIPMMFIGGIIFSELAVFYAAIVPGIDYFNYYFTLVVTPMFLFSGIFFPVSGLPDIVVNIAWFTPLYHLVNVTRGFAGGEFPFGDILWLIACAVIIAPLPFIAMRRRMIK